MPLDQSALDPQTEKTIQSYTKWIVAFILVVIIFVAAFAPLIYYAQKVEEMEENVEQILNQEANKLPAAAAPASPEATPKGARWW